MSRAPRSLTRTQELRQAKSAAYVRECEQKEQQRSQREPPPTARRRRPPPPEPKKVDFCKPSMTKSMLARMKVAEKFKQDYDQKKVLEADTKRRPRRTPAPVDGDARLGKERMLPRKRPSPGRLDRSRGTTRSPEPTAEPSQFQTTLASRRGAIPRTTRMPPTQRRSAGVSDKVAEIAQAMNADIVQAEPIGEGPIDSIVIPPGTISDNRTTIVSIAPPSADLDATSGSQVANRSIQVISETLDEQDAVEAATVQCRLEDLQQARREFVMAVANVGGNAVNIGDEASDLALPPSISIRPPTPPARSPPPPALPQVPQKYIYKIPDITTDERFQYTYGPDHPTVAAARDFARRNRAAFEQQQSARRMEDEFQRVARQAPPQDFRMDIPIEEELMHGGDISWEEDDETGMEFPCAARIKAPIPTRQEPYQHEPFDPDELERFFDVQNYPPCARPLPGREHMNPDLWDIDDPWYRPESQAGADADLIDFDGYW